MRSLIYYIFTFCSSFMSSVSLLKLLYLFQKCLYLLWAIFLIAALRFLTDNSRIFDILVMVPADDLFSGELRFYMASNFGLYSG